MPAPEPVRLGRKRALPSCPNPLFLKWLTELRDEAKERGLKIQHTYQKAISSLNKYPLPLKNAKEAKILQNFGDGICKILDDKLQRYYRERGPNAPIHSLTERAPPPGRLDNNNMAPPKKKNAAGDQLKGGGRGGGGGRKKREYVPQKRSGGYAVLLTLYRQSQIPDSKGFMFKMELQAAAQLLCDKSFTAPDLGTKYTAWSSVSTLIQKNLLLKTHNPARYSLTDEGLALAQRLDLAEQKGDGGAEGEEVRSEGEEEEEEENGPGLVDLTGSDEEEEDNRALSERLTRSEDRGARSEDWGARSEDRGARSEDRGVRSEDRGARSEDRGVRSKDRGARSEDRGVRSEDRGARSEDRGVRSEDRGVRSKDRGARSEDRGVRSEDRGASSSVRPADSQGTSGRKPTGGRLLPGQYDIILCVDFIETTGGSHHCKQELVKELQRNGVTFDVRKLNVGDFLWVAREKLSPVPGQLRAPAGRELVLDYIVERKRMDDLCGSIIDGRFREQKFRLKRCGLRRPIYLVEECKKAASHLSLPETTLQQAIVNTQVVDGFFVKRVQDVRESAAYLTVMTRHLTKLYQNRTLTCRSRELEGDTWTNEDPGNPSCSLISFSEFNHGAVKNKSQTVREVFARQLMQISGLSGDKAAAILEQFSSPHSLLTAYGQCAGEAEKEKLLSSIRYGKLKRNVGPALSRTVYQLYCTRGELC